MKKRISFWIPEEYQWLFSAIEEVQSIAEKRGVRLSQADIILTCIVPQLKSYSEYKRSKRKKKKSKSNLKRCVSCTQDNAWVFETIDRLVDTKHTLGLPATFSSELIRLARSALIQKEMGKK